MVGTPQTKHASGGATAMSIYLRLVWAYLKIGLFGFGGGYAMLSLIENEVVKSG